MTLAGNHLLECTERRMLVGNDIEILKREELIEEIEVNSIEEIYKKIIYNDEYNGYIFRGHGEERYKLIPTLLREEYIKKFNKQSDLCLAELRGLILFFREANSHGLFVPEIPVFYRSYLSEFFELNEVLYCSDYHWLPDDIIKLAILAQHYGVKTRLLDWTRDVRVALYFACKDEKNTDGKANVWCIDARWLQDYRRKDITSVERLAHIVANEYSSDHDERRKLIEMTHDDSFPLRFFISAYSDNANLNAQQGVLSMWQHNLALNKNKDIPQDLGCMRSQMEKCIEDFLDGNISDDSKSLEELLLEYFSKGKNRRKSYREARKGKPLFLLIKFDKKLKSKFLELLRKEGYDEGFIFPGYKSIANMVNKKI